MPMYVKPIKLMMHYNPLDPFHWIIVKKWKSSIQQRLQKLQSKILSFNQGLKMKFKIHQTHHHGFAFPYIKYSFVLEFHYNLNNLLFISDKNACSCPFIFLLLEKKISGNHIEMIDIKL